MALRVLHLGRDGVERPQLNGRRKDRAGPVADDSALRGDGEVAMDLVGRPAQKVAPSDGLPVRKPRREQKRRDGEEREEDAKTRVRDRRRHPSPPRTSSLGARSPPTPRSLTRCRDGLRWDDADCRGAGEAEPLRFRFDPSRRVGTGALDDEKGVLPAELVALRQKALRLISRGRYRRRLRQVEKREKKARDDHTAREKERTDLPARAADPCGLARRLPMWRDGVPVGTVLHAPRLRRAHGLREGQERRSAARRAALRARGLRSTSAEAARSGRRVRARKPARCPQTQVGRWGGQMQSRDSRAKNCLPIRSSREWNEITTIRPPGRRTRMAAASPCSRFASSSLTAMRSAWKTRVAGSMPRGLRVFTPATKRPRSSAAPNGILTRRRTIAPATRAASGSSPYSAKTRRRSFSAQLFTTSAAVARRSGSARMSNGPVERKLKPRSSSASWMDERPRSRRTPSTGTKLCSPARSSRTAKFPRTRTARSPKRASSRAALASAAGSRSSPRSRPFRAPASRMAAAWPPPPTVPSR